ncbi:unnamed protein product [Aspergillus oryzae var. brunneus]|uniref:Unnamed protein product n=2 Tax=Aspergillus oryzae TaxID=5062 RepID=A0AAN4YM98_ASPOZ|nr:unnamed protein product [Aspergillus oryzae]GMG46379.1 unnamed protein product [Aspergillus oryzae var. brunneus]
MGSVSDHHASYPKYRMGFTLRTPFDPSAKINGDLYAQMPHSAYPGHWSLITTFPHLWPKYAQEVFAVCLSAEVPCP